MKKLLGSLVCFAALTAMVSGAGKVSPEWPFIISRQMPCMNYYPEVMEQIFDSFQANPGACDEIWFCIDGLTDLPASEEDLRRILPYRKRCEELGIQFSFQLGLTLGHGVQLHKARPEDRQFSEDAFRMNPDGSRSSEFCPTSPEALSYLYERTKLILEVLKPDSFWPDDDMRLNHGCYCPRCMKGFSEFCGKEWTREELYHHLMGTVNEPEPVRGQWVQYEGKLLAGAGEVFRRAVEEVHPDCRLGVQADPANAHYTGPNKFALMKALSGPKHNKVGIRPGGGFYNDKDFGGLVQKYLCIQEEGAKCRQQDFVGQICYEAENYPHIALLKNPQCMMNESMLMLAGGVDSLALYWHSGDYYESARSYDRFAELCAQYRPYWEALRDRNQSTVLYGISRPLGTNAFNAPRPSAGDNFWVVPHWDMIPTLVTYGLPICPAEAHSEVTLLTDNTILGLTKAELEHYLAGPVIMDVPAWMKLNQIFPQTNITVTPYAQGTFEVIDGASYYYPLNSVRYLLQTDRTDVEVLATFESGDPANRQPLGISSMIVPSGFGGKILLVNDLYCCPTTPKRQLILNGLDKITPNRMAVRMETHEQFVMTPRVDADGKIQTITLLNLSSGETDTIQLTVRSYGSKRPYWSVPCQKKVRAKVKKTEGEEGSLTITLPPLGAYQIGTLYF
ncbi:MAG: hypothetical protein IK033_06030 [Verrucomicrobia bacterium]|nr:hypothetical protein [Verrucomicrobiota bacterium]